MKRNIDNQKEWETIGATFSAGISQSELTVPENYFDTLPQYIMTSVKASLSEKDFVLPAISLPFELPAAYFENLDSQILKSVLDAELVFNQLEIEGVNKESVFEIPNSYFDQLDGDIMAKLVSEPSFESELEESSLLLALKGSNPFSKEEIIVEEVIQERTVATSIKEQPVAEVPMAVRKSLRWSKMLSVASVALFFVLGGAWLHFDSKTETASMALLSSSSSNLSAPEVASKKLASLSDAQIEAYLDLHVDEFSEFMLESNVATTVGGNKGLNAEKALDKISDKDLEDFVDYGIY